MITFPRLFSSYYLYTSCPVSCLCLTLKLWPAHLLVYGQQQGVPGLYPRLQQDLHQLGVLIDDGDGERGPAQRVRAVDV